MLSVKCLRFNKLFALFFGACVALGNADARAQAVMQGCDPLVWDVMNKKAQAYVAQDVAIVRELIEKPDSVLALTCFNDSAGISAVQGGGIFSGTFLESMVPVIPNIGDGTKEVCTEIDDMWAEVIDEGLTPKTPYATFDDLMDGTTPADAGVEYTRSWTIARDANVFSDYKNAYDALTPTAPVTYNNITSYCDALSQVYGSPCPFPP